MKAELNMTNITDQQLNALPVMESFYTIQGEGFYQGSAAYFIRLGGCDVGCIWCDVKESWDENAHPKVEAKQLVKQAQASGSKIVVITGGEPSRYDLTYLTRSLKEAGLRVHIETSGAYALQGEFDWVCFSPKKFKGPDVDAIDKANELKVVVYNKSDFHFAEIYANQVAADCQLFLQPEWSREKDMLPLIIEYVKQNPKWKISLQIHKYMDVP
jgi:7-carboxy-7-deazaguanine synthase